MRSPLGFGRGGAGSEDADDLLTDLLTDLRTDLRTDLLTGEAAFQGHAQGREQKFDEGSRVTCVVVGGEIFCSRRFVVAG